MDSINRGDSPVKKDTGEAIIQRRWFLSVNTGGNGIIRNWRKIMIIIMAILDEIWTKMLL